MAIAVTVIIFFYRQTKLAGRNEQKQVGIEKQIETVKKSTEVKLTELESSLTSRLKSLEVRAYGNGDGGFITMKQHDKMQSDCQRQLVDQISRNAQLFERMAHKMDQMDIKREEVREHDNTRLGKIEVAIMGIQKDVGHLITQSKTGGT